MMARCGSGENASLGPKKIIQRGTTAMDAAKTGSISDYYRKSKRFYNAVFGITDFSGMSLPKKRICSGEVLFINNLMPIELIIEQYARFMIPCKNIAGIVDDSHRPKTDWYAADIKFTNRKTDLDGITLREHLLRGLKYCFETQGDYLDSNVTTVCTGSPFMGGGVPHVGAYGRMILIDVKDVLGDTNFCYYKVAI